MLPLVIATLAVVAWGTFAFGAVYEWAYRPLALGAILVGLFGLVRGGRPFIGNNRLLWMSVIGIALLAMFQLVPISRPWLDRLSPATVRFLASYDLGFAYDPAADAEIAGRVTPGHAISIAPGATRLGLLMLLAFAIFLAGLLRGLSRTAAGRIARGLVLIGCVLAIVGIAQKALLGDVAYNGMKIYGFWTPENLLTSPFGPFVNKNHFGGWMLMVIPLSVGLAMDAFERDARSIAGGFRRWLVWLSSPDGGRVMMYGSAALLMSVSLMLTRSRSAMACLALTTVLCAGAVWRRTGSKRTASGVGAALAALLLLGVFYAGSDAAIGRFITETDSAQLRLRIWTVAIDVWRAFPWLGSGLNTFGTSTVFYQRPGLAHYQEAHNDYLQLLAEGGLVAGAFLFMGIAGTAVGVRRRFAVDRQPESYWARVGAVIGLVAIAVQSLMEFSLQIPGNTALFVVLLALALYEPAEVRIVSSRNSNGSGLAST